VTPDALLVLSFGGPEGPADVLPFLERVTRGREVPAARLAEVARHYELFGGVSPINAAVRQLLDALDVGLPVYWGNRNWHPLLADTVERMADDGVRHALCFVTSAYAGFSSCRQYLDDIAAARAAVGRRAPAIEKLRHYADHPLFVDAFVRSARAALAELGDGAHAVFTAHSVPLAQAGDYEPEVRETAGLVAARIGTTAAGWSLAWQSRSGPPSVPWLEPDVGDHLEELAAGGVGAVALVPIGFVFDHMEVVYDLDVEAAARARSAGLRIARAATPGTALAPLVAELVAERTAGAPARRLGHRPAPSCCG
jgi:protoporphyrin/coproporphyrin ferrochelatase